MLETRENIWLALAELFFLDTESSEADYFRVAKILSEYRLSRKEVEKIVIYEVAPIAGAGSVLG
jgi:hypothetical protein